MSESSKDGWRGAGAFDRRQMMASLGGGPAATAVAASGGQAFAGTIEIDGERKVIRDPGDALRAGTAPIPEGRRKQALFSTLSLAENASPPALDPLSRFGRVRPAPERRHAPAIVERLSVPPDRPVHLFSGGDQRKALVGETLERQARVFAFAEPTSGVDVGAIRRIGEIILGMAAATVIVISASVEELLALSETVMVIHDGAMSALRPRAGLDRDTLLATPIGKIAGRELIATP